MAISTQPYKGARDFYPEDKRVQKHIFKVMRETVESFGYEEYDAPILEPIELYLAKSSEEIVNEQTYVFTDRGGRQVSIRPEMTPTVSRMVAARRQELAYPVRWYSIPNLWRYERPQRGRLREHWQLNVDIFGVAGLEADHEIIQIADALMRRLGAKPDMYTIRINSRRLVNAIIHDYLKLDSVQSETLIRHIDRMHKMEHGEFVALLDALMTPTQREAGAVDVLLQILKAKSLEDLPGELAKHEAAQGLRSLMAMLTASNITNAKFDVTLMRGFDYYTDIVFEVFDTNPENSRSLFGGGRYDGLVGLFGVEPVPTVGFGAGDVTIRDFLEVHHLLPPVRPETDIYVVLIGDYIYAKAQRFLKDLRAEGLKVAVDGTGRKLAQQIKTADKKGIPFVVFVGEDELRDSQYKLKNIVTGEEQTLSFERLVAAISAAHKRRPKDDI